MNKTPTALLTDIQRFSLHDGPGVRTTFFFKGCPLRCLWCANPEAIDKAPELYFVKSKCIGCGACALACPHGCIHMDRIPKVNQTCCQHCFSCAEACPTTALTKKGTCYSIEALLENALKDKEFYEQSGGGITASGGEPLLQSDAVAAFFRVAKQSGLHTAIETAGHVPWDSFEKVFPYCDLFYLDIKHADDETHRRLTGVGTSIIHRNLRELAARKSNLIVRIPLIPGCNMDDNSVNAFIKLLEPLNVPVELLLFHQLGQNKYEAIRREYSLKKQKPLTQQEIQPILDKLALAGIKTL